METGVLPMKKIRAVTRFLRKVSCKPSPKGYFYVPVHPTCPPEAYVYAVTHGLVVSPNDPDYQEYLRINNKAVGDVTFE